MAAKKKMPVIRTVSCKFIKEITVRDPDSGGEVEVEIWKDPVSGGMFGVDTSFLDQVHDEVPSPFDRNVVFVLDEKQIPS